MQEGKRQKQIAGLLHEELTNIFQRLGLNMLNGGLVSIASVKITPDLLEARIYLSLFKIADQTAAMQKIEPSCAITFEDLSEIPVFDVSPESDVVRLAKRYAKQNGHGKVAYGTEAGLFQTMAGIPTVVVGPGSIDQAHKPDEFIAVSQLRACEAFLRELINN